MKNRFQNRQWRLCYDSRKTHIIRDMNQDELKAQMFQLRSEFTTGLQQRFASFQSLLHKLHSDFNANDFQELFRQVHTLAGSAPSFGYTRLHVLARNFEQAILNVQKQNRAISDDLFDQFTSDIKKIADLANEGPDTPIVENLPPVKAFHQGEDDNSCVILLYRGR